MMTLGKLFEELDYDVVGEREPDMSLEISELVYDNRKCVPGCVFVAIAGLKFDGHDAAQDAFEKGAYVIVTEHDVNVSREAIVIRVNSTRQALSELSAAWFGYPARSLTTIALTGTKGKSTTAGMIRDILQACGHKTGIMGTIGVGIGDKVYKTNNTTPESYIVQEYLRKMVDEGCDSLVMEVSSQALKQHRVWGIIYDYALFTNLESDHIGDGEHASFEEYMYCKSLLFRQCRMGIGNADDSHFEDVVMGNAATPEGFEKPMPVICPVESFGCNEGRNIRADKINLIGNGGEIGIGYELKMDNDGKWPAFSGGSFIADIHLSIPGRFNVYNSLAAMAVCRHILENDAGDDFTKFGNLIEKAADALYKTHVTGRLEPVNISSKFSLMIDYAHNAMALESLLSTLDEYKPERLVCLFGCGGNRSKERRYEMGEVSSRIADLTIVTSDNPRFEKPEDIIEDILVGVRKEHGEYKVIPDRREAIRYVIENAQPGDMIVLAGKGQEDYQEIEGVKYHMDEREIVADVVKDGNFIR